MIIAILGQYPLNPEEIRGGVETCILGLENELKKYPDIELHIITIQIMWKDVTKIVNNVTIHYLASPPLPRFVTVNTIDKYKTIRKIKELKPDIVHAHMSSNGYYALKSGFPSLITVHGIAFEEYDPKIQPGLLGMIRRQVILPMERYVFEHAKVLTVVSPYVKTKIEPFCKGEIHVIPNGIRNEFFGIKNNEIENRLLFVGGIEPRKGLLNVLKAVEIVKKEIPDVELHIVGGVRKQGYYNSLIDYVNQNKLNENIIFKGELNDEELKKDFSECSVFVFPSKEESFGIVLAEAEACGKPVVASNIGGIPYVVDNNETGFLVEYGDVDALVKKILILLNDKNLRTEMGKAGKEKAKQFSNDDIAEKYYDLYKEMIDNGKGN
jgi:glycosyltransferase involved in cell wall biosynthesis